MARAAAIETARIAFAPSLLLVGVPSSSQHGVVELALLAGVHALQFGRDDLVDVVDRLQHAFAEIAPLVAVAQLQRFVLAGGGSAGNGSAAAGAAFQDDIGFNGRISAGVENFAGKNQFNFCHGISPDRSPLDWLARRRSG